MSPTAANKIVTHRGSELSRLIEQLRILSFGIADSDSGSSSRWLLDKLRISKLLRLAMAAGNTEISIKNYFHFHLRFSARILTRNLVVTQGESRHKQHVD